MKRLHLFCFGAAMGVCALLSAGEAVVTPPLPPTERIPVSEAHQAILKSLNETAVATNKAFDAAELVFYRAKDARDKAVEHNNEIQQAINMKFGAMKAEIKCQECTLDDTGKFWVKPPVPVAPKAEAPKVDK